MPCCCCELAQAKTDALMCFPYEPERVAQAGAHFDQMVARILAEDFAVHQPPEARVCRECNFRAYCVGKGATRQKRGNNR
jgi:CRISPR/Cas system-associated exonuclease Cas4 (RecB family)